MKFGLDSKMDTITAARRMACVGLGIAVGVALVACETNATPVGVTRNDQGSLVAVIHPCPTDAVVFGIRVERLDDHAVVWEISSTTGSSERLFTLGEPPPGFRQLVPYVTEPTVSLQVTFLTSAELDDEYGNVDPADARSGTVLVDGKHVTMQQFEHRNTCG